jgi:DNA polymerase III subunit alpha
LGFVHLNVESEFSMLESGARISSLVKKASELGAGSLALTDRNAMHGAVPFYEACTAAGIKPIIGVKLAFRVREQEFELILLAENNNGYRSLLALLTQMELRREREAFITLDDLKLLSDVFVIEPMYRGPLQTLLLEKDLYAAEEIHESLKEALPGRVFIEVQNHFHREEREILLALKSWLQGRDEQLTASNKVLAVEKEETEVCDLLHSIKAGIPLADTSYGRSSEYYLKSEDEMKTALEGWSGALETAEKLASRCSWELSFGEMILPEYAESEDAVLLLRQWCHKGVYERYGTPDRDVWERLEHELSVIESMQFADYFLIVADFMQFAHKEGITTGPGRGSAAGSLVAYVLRITDVDPLAYELLFERFLNPERVTMPDIDIDFADADRDKVIHYVADRYGSEHVAQIVTFGTFAAKAAVRDTGKALGVDSYELDRMAKLIPSRPGTKISDAEKNSAFTSFIEKKEELQEVVRCAKMIEGLPRHSSVHAAGIVISRDPLPEIVPLQQGNDGMLLTQYPMGDLEKLGLLKMDFLGLRNLTLIDKITKLAGIRAEDIPEEDHRVFELLGRGDTSGIFQLESQGMQKVLKQLQPTAFEDIVAVNALYRPGPMEFIPDYIARKHGRKTVEYAHPVLEPILKQTHGVMIYQEQIMQTAAAMAGFSLGEADILRRAVSKKKRTDLENGRIQFVNGAVGRGYGREEAEKVYDQIVSFADYGFNRSHAVAYSMITYRLAYLKAVFPEAFYTGMMESAVHDQEKLAGIIHEARLHGLKILPPSVQKSGSAFSLEENGIRLGLTSIRHINERTAQAVAEAGIAGGIRDVFELAAGLPKHLRSRKTLEALTLSGAMDSFGKSRAELLATLDRALEYAGQEDLKLERGEELFPDEKTVPEYAYARPLQREEELRLEKEMLGFYLSGHPLEEAEELLKKYKRLTIGEALKLSGRKKIRLAGLITDVRSVQTKKGDQMAFLELEDESGSVPVTIFPKVYKEFQLQLVKNEKLFMEGHMEEYEGEQKVIMEKAVLLSSLKSREEAQRAEVLYLYLSLEAERKHLGEVKKILENTPGEVPVVLKYGASNKIVRLSEMWNVSISKPFLSKLEAILGKNHVFLRKPRV